MILAKIGRDLSVQARFTRCLSFSPVFQSAYLGKMARKTVVDINEMYELGKLISMVTAHDYITGRFAENAEIDINLVGDSLAMVALGYDSTNEITMDEFLYHVRAVVRGNSKSMIVADVPFGYYEASVEQAVHSVVRLVKETKVQGIKVEGGREIAPLVTKLTGIGVPVMGHVGLTPQRHNSFGGFKIQGNSSERALEIYQDCLALEKAGVFSIVLECIPSKLAQIISSNLRVPTLGIGAGPHCSGQVLVMADMLGMNDPKFSLQPKFVKQYSHLFTTAVESLKKYKNDLEVGVFPDPEKHGYKMKKEALEELKKQLAHPKEL